MILFLCIRQPSYKKQALSAENLQKSDPKYRTFSIFAWSEPLLGDIQSDGEFCGAASQHQNLPRLQFSNAQRKEP